MEIMLLEAPYRKKIALSLKTLNYLQEKKYRKIALYASAQFCNQLERVEAQLQKLGLKIVSSQPDRTHCPRQLLGCDVEENSLHLTEEVDAFLYVGDGKFHPLALIYAQKEAEAKKEVICEDPLQGKMQILSGKEVETLLKKQNGLWLKFLSAKTIGVLISIKPGQEHLPAGFRLKELFPEKKFYFFLDDNLSFDQLENFPFIEIWVNTACPRISFENQDFFRKGVINLSEVLRKR